MRGDAHVGRMAAGIVEGYAAGGAGVVRVSEPEELRGAVAFVPLAVRGEEIAFRIVRVTKSAVQGKLVRVLRPAPWRKEPDCPYFGRCGGCAFRHLSYEEELRAKRRRVQDALSRLGRADVEVEGIAAAAHPLRYRGKAQYPVGPDGSIGFYQAKSHQVVPVEDCLLLPEAANRTAAALRQWMGRYGAAPYDERTGRGLIRHLYVRTNRTGESLCCVVANGRRLPKEPELAGIVRAAVPETAGVVLNVHTRPGNVVLGDRYRTIWGRDYLEEELCGLTFRLSLPSFFQVNREQAEVLYGRALDFAALTGRETVLDLYCGIGTITLCMAGRARRVIGAEIVPQAVEDARGNAARNGIENAAFYRADAAEIAARLAGEELRPDVVTVDPPRKGLAPEVIASIASMGPERVVYVSCDPGTLGRDVARFAERGYRAVRVAAVDLFPGTEHVETVVLMSRKDT